MRSSTSLKVSASSSLISILLNGIVFVSFSLAFAKSDDYHRLIPAGAGAIATPEPVVHSLNLRAVALRAFGQHFDFTDADLGHDFRHFGKGFVPVFTVVH
jgi:hypothetical protein